MSWKAICMNVIRITNGFDIQDIYTASTSVYLNRFRFLKYGLISIVWKVKKTVSKQTTLIWIETVSEGLSRFGFEINMHTLESHQYNSNLNRKRFGILVSNFYILIRHFIIMNTFYNIYLMNTHQLMLRLHPTDLQLHKDFQGSLQQE